ncbi:MAG TPA: hypothetical protein VMN37_00630 [Gemmatimonadales bacterium]|nr:hypothetical protein [Gemmatimonadales bacterium]
MPPARRRTDPATRRYAEACSPLRRGSRRIRLPVAAKTALASAGAVAAVPGSLTPPGGSLLRIRWGHGQAPFAAMPGVPAACLIADRIRV